MGEPRFNPSVNTQRHQYVIDFVKTHKPKKVVDLGCNDCSLLRKLKFHREIELLCGVDLKSDSMKKKMHELAPLPTDYLQPGASPLSIELYHGSVTQKDARLRGFDLVTSIELIEHLHLDAVEGFTEVLFGYMTPGTAIVSTPNVEFNPLFPRMPGFRNSDHKFEWTRAEFQSWALKACGRYGYEAEFTGVGQAVPHLHLRVGFCTQIAVFRRLSPGGGAPASSGDTGEIFSYKLLYSVSYPSLCDNNVLRGCLVSEVLHWAYQLSRRRRTEDGDEGWSHTEPDRAETEPTGDPRDTCKPQHEFEESVFDGEGTHGWEDVKMTSRGQLESYRQGRCVCVPLRRVWSCCPRIRDLSGSLARLRLFIADDPLVRLSQDGFAVVLDEGEEVSEEEPEYTNRMDPACHHAVEEEMWESL
ncbi:small RNA 2'-O-methyltransferase isoform X1 [Gadus chalcogrammus]|uniref:small RNA 2'-O-methyltransferase isoform X1 n=1 Tax=Gadus chalcogrammus TaxID=1042646 RepID=UPI0024C48E85|nr:small RNA 2'-O-methyltransferase isoform X1 [Gadus chalcogrammus]